MRLDQDPTLSSFGIHQPGSHSGVVSRKQRMIDEVSAVVAIDGSNPLQPRPDSLANIHRRLNAVCGGGSRGLRLAAWSGWACAIAASALAWHFTHGGSGRISPSLPIGQAQAPVSQAPASGNPGDANQDETPARQARMSQEIDALRQQLKLLAERDARRMTITPGVSWPVIMKLSRPGTHTQVSAVDLMLASIMGHAEDEEINSGPVQEILDSPPAEEDDTMEPAAIPIYDPARDKGQLILSHLPEPPASDAYHLWVKIDETSGPILVGTLQAEMDPVSTTMDFRLGSTGVIPDNFWITRDARLAPKAPSDANIILQAQDLR